MDNEKGKKPPIFSETIDSAINGYALGVSFVGIGVFLLVQPTYFDVPVVSYVIGALIGVIGVLGTGVELSKSSKIKGFDNTILGMVFIGIWLAGYLLIHNVWANILMFVFLVLGCYALCLGLFQGAYSIYHFSQKEKRDGNLSKKETVGTVISRGVLFLTELCGLVVAVLNIIQAITTNNQP